MFESFGFRCSVRIASHHARYFDLARGLQFFDASHHASVLRNISKSGTNPINRIAFMLAPMCFSISPSCMATLFRLPPKFARVMIRGMIFMRRKDLENEPALPRFRSFSQLVD